MTAGAIVITEVNAAAVTPTPWRNGGGLTRELLRLPAADVAVPTDDWLLRISLADITADGAFSAFDGMTRWFSVIAGAGVQLRWPDSTRELRAADAPLMFDGAAAPYCQLLAGPTRDLNVMVRHAAAHAQLLRAEYDQPWRWVGSARGLFTLQALRLQRGAQQHALSAGSLLWATGDDTSGWRLVRDSAAAGASDLGAPPGFWIGFREPVSAA